MRIGIISDIHSNIDALRAVYAEFQRRDVDHIICLGDIIGIGAHPEECVQFLKSIEPQILSMVRGNHEDYLLKSLPIYNHNDPNKNKLPQEIIDLFQWNHEQISNDSANFLRKFAVQESIKIHGVEIYVSHYPINKNGSFENFIMLPELQECKKLFRTKHARVNLFGHTHLRCLQISRSGKFYINPGSVGCPIGTDSASAGILTIDKRKKVSYEQLDVAYDVDHAVEDMLIHNEQLPAINYTVASFYKKA